MKKLFVLAVPLCLLIFSCEDALTGEIERNDRLVEMRSSNDNSTSTEVFSEPYEETVYNQCTDENVDVTGSFHTVLHLSTDANGVRHLSGQAGFRNTRGVGQTSGIKYRLVGMGSECEVPPTCPGDRNLSVRCGPANCPGGPWNLNVNIKQRLISQGPGDDLVIFLTGHITANANGEIVAFKRDLYIECH